MFSSNIISGEFSHAFVASLTHPIKTTLLSIATATATAGVASTLFLRNPVITTVSMLLGATSVMGWAGIYATTYAEELKKTIKKEKEDQALLTTLQKELEKERANMQLLHTEISSLKDVNVSLEQTIHSSSERIQRLQDTEKKTLQTIQILESKIHQQTEEITSLMNQKTALNQEILSSVELTHQAKERILSMQSKIEEKDLKIAFLEKKVEDLTKLVSSGKKM